MEGRLPDVVLLSETWLTPTSPPVVIDGYDLVHRCRTHKRGGGVGILVSKTIRYKECKSINSSIVENECVTIELELRSREKCIISSMYRPPNVNIQAFQSCYNSLICEMNKLKPKAIIIGLDHNLDFLKSNTHSGTYQFIQHNLDFNMIPTITRPTRITKNSATLIDNILVSQSLCGIYDSGILVDDISDHMPSVCVLRSLKGVGKDPIEITSRDTRPKNMTALKNHLLNYDWQTMLKCTDPNVSMNRFHEIIQSELDLCIPESTRIVRRRQVRRDPWITASLKRCIEKSKRLYYGTLKNNDKVEHYLAYRRILKKTLQCAKREFHRNKCLEFQQNSKKLWQLINKVSGRCNDKSCSIDCLSVNGIKEYSGTQIANSLARYFANVGERFAGKIPRSTRSISSYLELLQKNSESLFFTPSTGEEIKRIITELPSKRSSGSDNISNVLLKELATVLSVPLSMITNQSMCTGVFPDLMKLAEVVPLYKGKSREFETNYRPISLLTTMSKVMEKVVYKRVYKFLTNTGQICKTQYGFRSNHSCEHAIAQVVGSVLKNMEMNKSTIAVMLDLSKAFDTIEHSIMIQKLELFGVRGVCLDWFKSYLENRKMRVKCRATNSQSETRSDYHTVNYGTPQGLCLGPLIFLIFVNDMRLHLSDVESVQFADDTTILFGHRNENYLRFCVERELEVLSDWFKANKLTLNVDKSVFLMFNRNGKNDINHIKLGDSIINRVASTKFLGTWMDDKLNWQTHLSKLITKLKCGLGMLQRSNHLLSIKAKKLLYYGQVHSHLCYGIGVWGPMLNARQMALLCNLQRKCVKLIDNRATIRETFRKMRILTVNRLVEFEQSKLGYKLCRGMLPDTLTNLMLSDSNESQLIKRHSYPTRQKNILNRPNVKSKLYRNSFLYQAISHYSNLSSTLRDAVNLKAFSRYLKESILNE